MRHKRLLIGLAALVFTGCTGEHVDVEAGETEVPPVLTVPAEEQQGEAAAGENTRTRSLLDLNHLREGGFAFADRTGERLITIDGEQSSNHSTPYELAIGDSGTVLKVAFQYAQQADSENDGRATMYNFDHLAGNVYAVIEGTAKPNETYFLLSDENGTADSVLPVNSSEKGRAADDRTVTAIEAAKQRAVVQTELVASIGEDSHLFLAEFERQGDDMLASLVLQKNGELLFHDFPAEYDPGSTWRVDDGGTISAEYFDVMFAGIGENGPIVAITWKGFEGENGFILAQDGGELKETGIQAARYTAPA